MKKWIAGLMLAYAGLILSAGATATNSWLFTVPGQYTVSDPVKIEVSNGVARLKLQAELVRHLSFGDYFSNTASRTSLAFGPDNSITLTKAASLFAASGMYDSEIFDGGLQGQWRNFNVRASTPKSAVLQGLVAYYRMDNDSWIDAVSGQYGTPMGDVGFVPPGKYGGYAGSILGRATNDTIYLANSRLLHGATEYSICVWVNLASFTVNGGIVQLSNPSVGQYYFLRQGSTSGSINGGWYKAPPSDNYRLLEITTGLKTGTWVFVTITLNATANSGKPNIYVDGVNKAGTYSIGLTAMTPIVQMAPFEIGTYFGATNRISNGAFDEVMIFNRALSAAEVLELYSNSKLTRPFYTQIRSGSTPDLSSNFVGPDGTTNSFFLPGNNLVTSTAGFTTTNRYVQVRAFMESTTDRLLTPYLDSISWFKDRTFNLENTYVDFQQGTYQANVTNTITRLDTPRLCLDLKPNGGYYTDGKFLSAVFDNGGGGTWDQIAWSMATELAAGIQGLEGLWHLNGTWGDASGKGRSTTPPSPEQYTDIAKLGTKAAVFNGTTARANIALPSTLQVKTVEFWLKAEKPTSGILELVDNTIYLSLSNRMIIANGFSNAAVSVYVNGRLVPQLGPGWNYVVLTTESTATNLNLTVGEANNEFFEGQIDEMAIYSRPLSPGEIEANYARARPQVGGRMRLQVRSDTNNPPLTPFAGPGNDPLRYFEDPNGASPGQGQRYFQYQVYMDSDGLVSPALDSVTITYNSGPQFVDDTEAEFSRGTFDQTHWVGDAMGALDIYARGAAYIDDLTLSGFSAIWHMDEETWPAGDSVKDASGLGNHGTPMGRAFPVPGAKVGSRSGLFYGNNDAISLAVPVGTGNFTVEAWYKSSATNRCAILSTFLDATSPYLALELNSDGTDTPAPGRVAFVLSDGVTPQAAAFERTGLNDAVWHHLAGVRAGAQMHLYLDGVRVKTVEIGTGYPSPGNAGGYVAKMGSRNVYFGGLVDEVVVFTRALSDAEMADQAAAGYNTRTPAVFTGPVVNLGRSAIWDKLRWATDGRYSCPTEPGDVDLRGLWPLNAVTAGQVVDISGNGRTGLVTGAAIDTAGKFSNCVSFTAGADQRIAVADRASLEPAQFTIEAWIRPTLSRDFMVIDKSDESAGYRLGADGTGRYYFWVNGTLAGDYELLRADQWTHLAGVYDGAALRLYVNGIPRGKATLPGALVDSASELRMGLDHNNNGDFGGRMDEVSLTARALNVGEIWNHYLAGAATLKMQARSWDPAPQGNFIGPDGTPNTYFTVSEGSDLLGVIGMNQNFQYQAVLATEDYRWTPHLHGVWVNVSGYPVDDPWVIPADGFGFPFLGRLTGFAETPGPLNQGSMKYFLSGDNGTNWYYWNSSWQNANGFGADLANNAVQVQTHVGTFRDEVYPNAGGTFKFKAFLNSDGSERSELDRVDLAHAVGRLVVTVPNGSEVGERSWMVGYTHTIRWATEGLVSDNLAIEYSINSGGSWLPIATGVSNSGSYVWTTPGSAVQDEQNHVRIRISDLNDSTIWDMSDSDFEIKWRFNVTAPNGGEKWYIGRTNSILWEAARNLNTVVIDYSPDGSNYSRNIVFGYGGVGGTSNVYVWASTNQTAGYYANWVSEMGRIRIQTLAGFGSDASDSSFTLAGIVVTDPTSASAWKKGNAFNIHWVSAGGGSTVKIEFSATGPAGPFVTINAAAPNVAGSNSYNWLVNVIPTPLAVLRITSNSDPALVGLSEVFTVADIAVQDPSSETNWLMNASYPIHWLSAGAGSEVNLYYSTNSGLGWIPITTVPVVTLDTPATNEYIWTVEPFPTRYARIRVESVLDPENLYGQSSDFNIAGVKMLSPNGYEKWNKGSLSNVLVWTHQSVGATAKLKFSYDGGMTYVDVAPFSVNLSDFAFPFVPAIPTIKGMARIEANGVSQFTNVADNSDNPMTIAGILMQAPTNGAVYTIGTSNDVKWISAGSEDPLGLARIYYASDGVNYTNMIAPPVGNNQSFPGGNSFTWVVSPLTEPSAIARMRVESGGYTHETPTFTLRGIRLNRPSSGEALTIGGNSPVTWKQAGLSSDAMVDMYLSTDGGATWSPTPLNTVPWPVNAEVYAWSPVAPSADPTTNAMIKMVIVSSSRGEDVGYEARSRSFVFKGMKVLAPNTGDIWPLNSIQTIRWLAAGAGSPVTIYYAANGVSYDTLRPVAANLANGDGLNSNIWSLETFRTPSTNARIKVQSALTVAISNPFRVPGIKVTAPVGTDIWAVDETNRISWTSVGAVSPYRVELIKDGGAPELLAAGVGTNYFDWVITSNSISSNAVIQVTDSIGFSGASPVFKVVGEPTISMVAPTPGEYWRVSDPAQISWSRGGRMANNFSVKFSTAPYVITNDIGGVVFYDSTNNTFNLPWNVPDRLGPTRIIVQHNDEPTIRAETAIFYVVGRFQILYPNGGETNLFARKPTTVNWYTRGSVGAVNLYYSADPLHQVWSLIANNVPNNGTGVGDVLTTYDWVVPNLWADDIGTVQFRVEQADRIGASDDSDSDFWVRYYTIVWHVYDQNTSNELDSLSVSDSSGWSAAGLASPVTRKYPYGTFDTIWSRALFFDKVVFNWLSEPSRSLFVPMISSTAVSDYKVMSNFYYDPAYNRFLIQSWLERAGNILGAPSLCTISIYDQNGALISTLVKPAADAQGVFWQEWNIPTDLDRKQIYFAKVEIVFSGNRYSSGVTYSLRLPADLEQAEVLLSAIDNARTSILANVSTVGTNVINLASAEAAFRMSAGARLDTLTNLTTRIAAEVTNLDASLADFRLESLTRLDTLTNTIGVIGPGGTSLVERIDDLVNNGLQTTTARILSRATAVRLGSTISIFYRTKPAATPAPTLRVRNSLGVVKQSGAMTEEATGTGIFEYSIHFDPLIYAVGEYWIECSDATSSDRIGIQVTQFALDDFANLLEVSNQLDQISILFSNLQTTVGTLAPLTNLASVVSRVESEVASLTNLPGQVDRMDLAMSNRLDQINLGLDQVIQVSSNLQAAVTLLATITNLDTRLAPLTNMTPVLNELSSTLKSVDLPTMADQVDKLALNLANYQPGSSNSLDSAAMMKSLEEVKIELGRQAGMGARVTEAIKKAQSASSAASKAGTAAQSVKNELGQGRISEALKILSDLRQTLSETKPGTGEESSSVTTPELDRQLDALIRRINELAAQKGTGPLITGKGPALSPEERAELGKPMEMTGTGAQPSTSDHEAIVQLNARLEEVRAMMAILQSLMEQTVNKPVVVDWLESGTP
jgi:hypothetical protein